MRKKNEALFDCLERNGYRLASGPKNGNYSTVTESSFHSIYTNGRDKFIYGIMGEFGGLHLGNVTPIPKCCAEYKPLIASVAMPRWARLIVNALNGNRKRQRIRMMQSEKRLAWIRMDVNEEIRKVREQMQNQ